MSGKNCDSRSSILESLKGGSRIIIQENPPKYLYYGRVLEVVPFSDGNSPQIIFSGYLKIYNPVYGRWVRKPKMSHYVSTDDTIWQVKRLPYEVLTSLRPPFRPREFHMRFRKFANKLIYSPSQILESK